MLHSAELPLPHAADSRGAREESKSGKGRPSVESCVQNEQNDRRGSPVRRGGMGPSVPEQGGWGGWIQQRGGLATPGLKDRMAV